jgi:hypothetical protein
MVVCPMRHDAITKGAVVESEQRAAKSRPINIDRGLVDGVLSVSQDYCAIELGSNVVAGEIVIFRVNHEPLLGIGVKDGRLSIDLMLYDSEGHLLVMIVDNEWVSGDPLPWDIYADHQKLRIRTRKGEPRLEVNAVAVPIRLTARLTRWGKEIVVRPSGITTRGGTGGHLNMDNTVVVGVSFDFDTVAETLTLTPDGRPGSGTFCIESNRFRRAARAREELNRIQAATEALRAIGPDVRGMPGSSDNELVVANREWRASPAE